MVPVIDGSHRYAALQEVLHLMAAVALPAFTADDLLPVGDYRMTFADLRASVLTQPQTGSRYWDHTWRSWLVDNLEVLVNQLWQVGITEIFADGSFVENKDHPNDIDGYFVTDVNYLAKGNLQRDLNLLDPHKVWTWDPRSRTPAPGFFKKQLPMWHRYRVELFPHATGVSSGIKDQYGNEQEFPAAFRKSRHNHAPKGIVQIVR